MMDLGKKAIFSLHAFQGEAHHWQCSTRNQHFHKTGTYSCCNGFPVYIFISPVGDDQNICLHVLI
jgi:hypothetical protein